MANAIVAKMAIAASGSVAELKKIKDACETLRGYAAKAGEGRDKIGVCSNDHRQQSSALKFFDAENLPQKWTALLRAQQTNDWAEPKIEAECKGGLLLRQIERSRGGDRRSDDFQTRHDAGNDTPYQQALEEAGLPKGDG